MVARFIKWLIFGVFLAIAPLGLYWLINFIFDNEMSYEQTVARGELFIISAALCGASLSELLVKYNLKFDSLRIGLGGISVIVLIISGGLYSVVSTPSLLKEQPDSSAVMIASTIIYLCALVINGYCVCVRGDPYASDI